MEEFELSPVKNSFRQLKEQWEEAELLDEDNNLNLKRVSDEEFIQLFFQCGLSKSTFSSYDQILQSRHENNSVFFLRTRDYIKIDWIYGSQII
ncbi:hypothetical protein AAAC51_35620 [Priestia megaterium]